MILIEDEDLFTYENILKSSLTADKKNWDDQINQATTEYNNDKENRGLANAGLSDGQEKQAIVYKALEICFNWLTRSPEDIMAEKAKLYAKKYTTLRDDIFSGVRDSDNDGLDDYSPLNIPVVR